MQILQGSTAVHQQQHMSHDARKPVYGDSDQVWHKPACIVTEAG